MTDIHNDNVYNINEINRTLKSWKNVWESFIFKKQSHANKEIPWFTIFMDIIGKGANVSDLGTEKEEFEKFLDFIKHGCCPNGLW